MVKTHKDLHFWQRSLDLVDAVFDMCAKLPSDEKFGITSQIKRAAISIPSNIAEGSGRRSKKELLQFISIARGSLAELETQCIICKRRKWITEEKMVKIDMMISEISRMCFGLVKSINAKPVAV